MRQFNPVNDVHVDSDKLLRMFELSPPCGRILGLSASLIFALHSLFRLYGFQGMIQDFL